MKKTDKKRNLTIDYFRGFALLIVVLYHLSIISQKPLFNITVVDTIIQYSGEIGVTLFFIISGYGIYTSLSKSTLNNTFSFYDFFKKRLGRVTPPYYICLIVLIFLGVSVSFLSRRGFIDILAHFTYTHNLTHLTSGTINGALWTMGTIVQFYLISFLLFKIINKFNIKFIVFILPFTIIIKYLFFTYILSAFTTEGVMYFIYGRQLIFCLDNFVLGMFLAKLYNENKLMIKAKMTSIIGLMFSLGFLVVGLNNFNSTYLYDGSLISASFHTILAIALGLIIYFSMSLNFSFKSKVSKGVLIYSKYEYETYLWHIIIIQLLLTTEWFKSVINSSTMLATLFVLIVTFVFGYFSHKMFESINYADIMKKIKLNKSVIASCVLVCICVFIISPISKSISSIIDNSTNYSKGIIEEYDLLNPVIKHVNSLNLTLKEGTRNIYLDNTDLEGTMNYYRIKYYMTDMHFVEPFGNYSSYFVLNQEEEVLEFLKDTEFDYLVVKYSPFLESNGFEIDEINGSVFKKNSGSHKLIEDYLTPIHGGEK